MCNNCLTELIESIEEYQKEIEEHLEKNTCECCSLFPKFLYGVCSDLKVLSLTKIKKNNQVCLNGFRKMMDFEELLKYKIKGKLNNGVEQIDDCKEDMKENSYIIKMNQLKELNETFEAIEAADHR